MIGLNEDGHQYRWTSPDDEHLGCIGHEDLVGRCWEFAAETGRIPAMIIVRHLVIVAAVLAIASASLAQATPSPQVLKIATLESVEANQNFERNVAKLQQAYRDGMALQQRYNAATSDAEKAALKKRIDDQSKAVTAFNTKMVETYGFTLTRQYVRIPERSAVYLVLTDEEVAGLADSDVTATTGNPRLHRIATLEDIESNEAFRRNVQVMQTLRQHAASLAARVDLAITSSERELLQARLEELLAKLNENNRTMIQSYRYSLNRQYVLGIEQSALYLVLTDAEVENMAPPTEATTPSG
jgi:hypothetical protein